jgi:hypothetical protein
MEHPTRHLIVSTIAGLLLIVASLANVVYGLLAVTQYQVDFLHGRGFLIILYCYAVWLTLLITLVPILFLRLPKWLRIFRKIVLISTVTISVILFVLYLIGAYQIKA